MTAPALEAARFSAACLLGMGLGVIYGFLRPLRPKLTTLSDLLFMAFFGWAWVYLSFGICRGDFGIGYFSGLPLGILLWETTAGRLLRPVFSGFWRIVRKLLGIILLPVTKILQMILLFCKKIFAYPGKWGTIKGDRKKNHHRKERPHEKVTGQAEADPLCVSPQQ